MKIYPVVAHMEEKSFWPILGEAAGVRAEAGYTTILIINPKMYGIFKSDHGFFKLAPVIS